jgi:carbonic anhydrase
MSQHSCTAFVLHCMDFRLQKAIHSYLDEKGVLGDCDIVAVAGAAKGIVEPAKPAEKEYLLTQLELSIKLHGTKVVYLMNHTDCGAYGGAMAFDTQEEEAEHHFAHMEKAAAVIREKHSDIVVKNVLIRVDGSEDIKFEES